MNQIELSRRALIKTVELMVGAFIGEQLINPRVVRAFEDVVLDSKVGMFHQEGGAGIASFIRQMESEGRVNKFASELAFALHERKPIPPSYVITVDDGYSIQNGIIDYLTQQNLQRKVTFYVMGDWRGDGVHSYMSGAQIKDLSDSGVAEIGCHTRDHPTNLPALRTINYGSFMLQIAGAKSYLEDLTAKPVWTFAYPYGNFDKGTVEELEKLYLLAFTTVRGNQHRLSAAMSLPRISIN